MIETVDLARGRCCVGCRGVVFKVVRVTGRQSGDLFALCDECQGRLLDYRDTLEATIAKLLA